MAIDFQNHVTAFEPRHVSRAVLVDAGHQGAFGLVKMKGVGKRLVDFLDRDAQARVTGMTGGNNLIL